MAGMGRTPDGRNVEIVSAAMSDVDLHVGQFGEHAMIELVTPEQIDAAGLLTHVIGDRNERDLAFEIDAAFDRAS